MAPARDDKTFVGSLSDSVVLLRGSDPTPALDGIDVPKSWYVDVDPVEVL